MAAILWSDVTGMFSTDVALAALTVAAQDAILAWVNEQLNVDLFGGEDAPKTRLARIHLAAHMATMGRRGGAAGPVTSSSAGGLSRSFATPPISANYDATSYGSVFKMLLGTTPARVGFAT